MSVPPIGLPLFGTIDPQEGRKYVSYTIQSPVDFTVHQLSINLLQSNVSQICGMMVDNTLSPMAIYFQVQDTGFTWRVDPHTYWKGPIYTGSLQPILNYWFNPVFHYWVGSGSIGANGAVPIRINVLNWEPEETSDRVFNALDWPATGLYGLNFAPNYNASATLGALNTLQQILPADYGRVGILIRAVNSSAGAGYATASFADQNNAIAGSNQQFTVELPPMMNAGGTPAVVTIMELQATEDCPLPKSAIYVNADGGAPIAAANIIFSATSWSM